MSKPAPAADAPRAVASCLSTMFFLQFAVFGSQTILLAGHMRELGFTGTQISWVYATGALAALVSPVVAGFLADHFLPTQRLVGICYLLCGPPCCSGPGLNAASVASGPAYASSSCCTCRP